MNRTGPVIIIEDDPDDQSLLLEIFQKLNYSNEILFFSESEKALEFLISTDITPFLIISDINMPKLDGYALREKIRTDAKLHTKCIPYLFFSTAGTQKTVVDAYSLSVQGFFVKQNSIAGIEKTITVIMEYWKRCLAPNDF